jgi:hypothetical protein
LCNEAFHHPRSKSRISRHAPSELDGSSMLFPPTCGAAASAYYEMWYPHGEVAMTSRVMDTDPG